MQVKYTMIVRDFQLMQTIEKQKKDDLEYLVTRCIQDEIIIYKDSVSSYLELSSPPLTRGRVGQVVENLGTIEAGRSWTVDIASYSHFPSDRARARKMLKIVREQT